MKQAGLNSKVSITKDFFQNSLFNFQGPARDIRGYSSAGRAHHEYPTAKIAVETMCFSRYFSQKFQ